MDAIHYVGFTESGKVLADIRRDEIEFRHPRCESSVVVSLADFRRLEAVECTVCGAVLGVHAKMISDLESSLSNAVTVKRRRDRGSTRRHILEARDRLLNG